MIATTDVAAQRAASRLGLSHLSTALDCEAMERRLAPLIAGVVNSDRALGVRRITVLASKAHSRALLEYEMSDAANGAALIVLGKLFADAVQAERVAHVSAAMWNAGFEPRFAVPRPLGSLPDLAMTVSLTVDGPALDDVIGGGTADAAASELADWLSHLHRSHLALDRALDLEREAVNVSSWAEIVAREDPSATEVVRLARTLRDLAREIAIDVSVPIHKDLHYRHVLLGERLAVVDYDEMRVGDPAFDVAHFVAYLELLGVRRPALATRITAFVQAFTGHYARRTGWSPDARFAYFSVYTFVKIARQLATLRGIDPVPRGAEQRRQIAAMVDLGLRQIGELV